MTKPPIVTVVGPTGVGKTALSMALAEQFPVEIVSVDSRQVYQRMDIGTAKPTSEERARVPHHLIDVVEATQEFSLAAFLELARTAIGEIQARGKLPLLVGGTGQYLWALLEAWNVPAVPPDRVYRHRMAELAEAEGAEALRLRLAEVDPKAAAMIDPRNVRRMVRALEVHHVTGVAWSEMRRRGPEPYRALIIGLTLPRQELYHRIDARVERMIQEGWVDEVKGLLRQGVASDYPSMASVGYRELAACLAGDAALEEAIRNIKIGTHRFARHQYAWFRLSDARIRWLEAKEDVGAKAVGLVRGFLAEAGWAHTVGGAPTG